MKKLMTILLNTGLIISAIFGVTHFIIPLVFNWSSYLTDVPKYITVSIEWINIIMSLLLSGYSVLLIVFQHKIKQNETIASSFFGFLVFVYLVKSIITIAIPWGMNAIGDTIEIASSVFEFVLLLTPFLYYRMKGHA